MKKKVVSETDAILSVKGLSVNFYSRKGIIHALQGISFKVKKKKTMGIIGESGSGKSVLALSILNLIDKPGKIESGEIFYKGKDLLKMSQQKMDGIRGGKISMIFSDPMSAFDPTLTVGVQVVETIRRHHSGISKKEAKEMAIEIFRKVKIPSPEMRFDEYPSMFSGGMIQRVMIADALSSNPDFIIADNPTQALDVTIQSQILELMSGLQETYGTTFILITNSFPILARYADEIIVLYAGVIVECGEKSTLLKKPKHPYTKLLIESIPKLSGKRLKRLKTIKGFSPDLLKTELDHCIFSGRCDLAFEKCFTALPGLTAIAGSKNHFSNCFLTSGTMLSG